MSLSTTIVRHVAAEKDVAPSDLRPLYEVIDPEALDLLFDPLMDGTVRANGRVIFEYSGCQVVVTETGAVQATLLGDH
ncbi:HalOD1 output domain-containing protein [Haladaptatus sp. CMAA 1909]|uniref:HalOD1 output domain-containing protein n=1 Tax=Haladaptatus sp. CMAA 1909 TaxID=3368986 RepID=UPI0037547DF6